MSERIKAFWLGLFILGAILIVAWLIMFLKPSVGDGRVTLRVRFSNIEKVEEGTRVTFAGKPVGEVKEIEEIADPRAAPSDEFGNLYIYELTLKVDSSVQVYSYDEIIFTTQGLLGEKSVAIIPRAAPPGAPSPQEVTNEVLFAHSTDKLQETLNQVAQVAEQFGETMEGVNSFLSSNTDDFNRTLVSISGAADEVQNLLATTFTPLITEIREQQIVERMGRSLDNIHRVTGQIADGEGTVGQLLQSDALYLQISEMMQKIDIMLSDINNYGLLFQYNRKWQRLNKCRQACEFYDCCIETN